MTPSSSSSNQLPSPRFLVTGASGLVGGHFIRYLLALKQQDPKQYGEIEISGVGLGAATSALPKGIFYRPLDLTDGRKTAGAIDDICPDYILHLAGAPYSDDWDALIGANIKTTATIMDAILANPSLSKTRVVVVGSAAEYGRVDAKDLPIRETLNPKPVSRYAMSMVARTALVQGYANLGVHAMVGRLFNPLSRNISEHFAAGSFAKQVRAIAAGEEKPPIKVGNLSAKRDFIDLEDASAAFFAIVQKGKAGEIYNVCTGRTHSMGQMLDEMIKISGAKIPYIRDESRIRANEVPEVVGSMEKIANQTGWKPRVSFEESIRRMMQ